MVKPESAIENYLHDLCKTHGFLYFKFVSPQNLGVPDRIMIGHGLTVFVELKAPGQKPRISQVKRFSQMRQYGAQVYVVSTKHEADLLINKLTPANFKSHKTKPKSIRYKIQHI